jgi:hypothetical protein
MISARRASRTSQVRFLRLAGVDTESGTGPDLKCRQSLFFVAATPALLRFPLIKNRR